MRIQIAIGLACVIVMAFYSPAIEANPGQERSFNDLKSKNAENEGANVIDKILIEQRSAGEFLSASKSKGTRREDQEREREEKHQEREIKQMKEEREEYIQELKEESENRNWN